MAEQPREYRYKIGNQYDVLITGAFTSPHTWVRVMPTITITKYAHDRDVIGETVHFSQAKNLSTVKRRLQKFADSVHLHIVPLDKFSQL